MYIAGAMYCSKTFIYKKKRGWGGYGSALKKTLTASEEGEEKEGKATGKEGDEKEGKIASEEDREKKREREKNSL